MSRNRVIAAVLLAGVAWVTLWLLMRGPEPRPTVDVSDCLEPRAGIRHCVINGSTHRVESCHCDTPDSYGEEMLAWCKERGSGKNLRECIGPEDEYWRGKQELKKEIQ